MQDKKTNRHWISRTPVYRLRVPYILTEKNDVVFDQTVAQHFFQNHIT